MKTILSKVFFLFLLFTFGLTLVQGQQNYALFFAVNQYEHYRPLGNPIQNAEDIAFELEQNYHFKTEVVRDPTISQIDQKLRSYQQGFADGRLASDGQLLLFFTGHGVRENRNGYFLPKDAEPKQLYRTAVAYEIWREVINNLNCKHILVVIDACFSGTFDPDWWDRPGSRIGTRPGELGDAERLLAEHKKYRTRIFFTSGAEEETPDRSRFAYRFLEGLKSGGGSDGILTSSEIFTFLEKATPKPHKGEFGDDQPGSNFLFVSKIQNPKLPEQERVTQLESRVNEVTGELMNELEEKYLRQNEVFKEAAKELYAYLESIEKTQEYLSASQKSGFQKPDADSLQLFLTAYNEAIGDIRNHSYYWIKEVEQYWENENLLLQFEGVLDFISQDFDDWFTSATDELVPWSPETVKTKVPEFNRQLNAKFENLEKQVNRVLTNLRNNP